MNKFYTNGKCNVQEVYYPLALLMGCGAVERHLEMAQPTKKSVLGGAFMMIVSVSSCSGTTPT